MAGEIVKEGMEEEMEEVEIEADQYLVFKVKSQEFGIQAMRVQEISSLLGTTQVPGAPPYIEGILNLRGQLATVINFRKKLEFEQKGHDEDTRVVVVEHGGFPIGIIVDSVEEVIKVPDNLVRDIPEEATTRISEEYITGVGMIDERIIILLDAEKLLGKEDLAKAVAAGEAARAPDVHGGPVNVKEDAAQEG